MSLVIADRINETSTTTGHGPMVLKGAVPGFATFSSKCSIGDTVFYGVEAVDANGNPTGDWECGLGTYSATNTLTLTTMLSSSTGDAVSFAAGTKRVFLTMPGAQVQWIRERLSDDRIYYVRKDGSDNNSGLEYTGSGAFLTIGKAFSVISNIDWAGRSAQIYVGPGTYVENLFPLVGAVGLDSVYVQGVGSATVIDGEFSSATLYLLLSDMKVMNSSSGGVALYAERSGVIEVASGVEFGACGGAHMRACDGGTIYLYNDYAITGASARHLWLETGGKVLGDGGEVTLTGTPATSIWLGQRAEHCPQPAQSQRAARPRTSRRPS